MNHEIKWKKIGWYATSVQALKPKTKRYAVSFEGKPGLTVRVAPTGVKSFIYRYQSDGSRKNMTIGTFPSKTLKELGDKYDEVKALHEKGIDPIKQAIQDEAAKQKAEREADSIPSVTEFVGQYLKMKESELREATLKEYRRYLEKYISQEWPNVADFKKIKITELKRHHIFDLAEYIATYKPNTHKAGKSGTPTLGAPTMANRIVALLSGMCVYAMNKGHLQHNCCARMEKFGTPTKRNRYLEWSEIKILCDLIETEATRDIRDAILIGLHTGQRISQIAKMELDWIKNGWIYYPAAVMKWKKPHSIPATKQLLFIIKKRRIDELTTKYVFPGTKEGAHFHPQSLKRGLERLQDRLINAGLKESLSFHDLRKTMSTLISEEDMGFEGYDELLLSHTDSGVTAKHYRFKTYKAEKLEAATAWSNRIEAETNTDYGPINITHIEEACSRTDNNG